MKKDLMKKMGLPLVAAGIALITGSLSMYAAEEADVPAYATESQLVTVSAQVLPANPVGSQYYSMPWADFGSDAVLPGAALPNQPLFYLGGSLAVAAAGVLGMLLLKIQQKRQVQAVEEVAVSLYSEDFPKAIAPVYEMSISDGPVLVCDIYRPGLRNK